MISLAALTKRVVAVMALRQGGHPCATGCICWLQYPWVTLVLMFSGKVPLHIQKGKRESDSRGAQEQVGSLNSPLRL